MTEDLTKVKEVREIAKEFHQTYEKLAPLLGYKTRKATAVRWSEVPDKPKLLMMETVDNLIERGIISAGPKVKGRVQVRQKRKAV
jgi:hypothetical protein